MRAYLLAGTMLMGAAPVFAQDAPPAQAEGDIVVTGQRAQQERAIAIKREAIGVVDVAASDEIGRLPDKNVAEVVERLPGVGVLYDQGEGRFVSIRGVPSELNAYTVNGLEIGNPDGNTRALPLDVISGQLLNRVEVVKAKTADMDGQGIGGAINLVTQTAFDFRESFVVQANAQAGYQEIADDKIPLRGDISIGGRFGADEQFGILLGASYSDRTFTSYGIFPDDWREGEGAPRGGMPTNIKYTDYALRRERIGATGSLDFRPSDDHQFFVRGIYSRFIEDEYRQRYRLDFATDAIIDAGRLTFDPDGKTGTATGGAIERRQDLRLEYKEKSVLSGQIGGSSSFGALKIDYTGGYTFNEVIEPNQLWQFRGNPGTVDFDFSDTVFYAAPRTELTPDGLNFRQYTEQDESGTEKIWQGRMDATYELAGFDPGSFLKAGIKYRNTDKGFDANNTTYTRGGSSNRFTLGQFDLGGDPVVTFPRGDRQGYLNAPTIDAGKIREFTAANLPGRFFVLDQAATNANATRGDFDLTEEVIAGYAMANIDLGAITITPGIRYERTNLNIDGLRLENGATIVPTSASSGYSDWLPSLIVRITPSDDTVFRLAYTRSVGRPEYDDLSPGASLEFEDEDANGQFEGSLSLGNAALKPYRSDNIDVSGEYYFARGGLISIGVFAKFIRDPIFIQSIQQENIDFGGRSYSRLTTSQPVNADRGDIIGLEAAFQQQFTFLPGLLSGFGVEANVTLIDSTLRVPGRTSATFANQSNLLYGGQIFYQKGGFEASVAYHHTGRSLLALSGDNPAEDQYSDDFRRLDAKASYAVTPNISVYAEAQNLTDEPTRQYQGMRRDWIIQNERYGSTYYAGVSIKL